MINTAFAMGGKAGAGAAGGGAAGGFTAFVPLILMFVIFYFLLIRPQQKKAKEHQKMIDNIKKGDRVITSGGIYGTVTSLGDTTVFIEIAEKVKIKLSRGNIAALLNAAPAASDKKNKKNK